MNAMEVIEQEG